MPQTLSLATDTLRLEVAPTLGGAAVRFDAIGPDGTLEPIFRPTAPEHREARAFEPNTSAFYPLLPWVSRLCPPVLPTSRGPLTIPPNRPSEAYPLHGWGAYVPWRITAQEPVFLRLELDHDGPPAFSAKLDYRLEGDALLIALNTINRMDVAVGMGLGFHPWLPRHADGRLFAPARHVWMSGADKIPFAAEAPPDDWDFSSEKPLPARDLDHGFGGWTGTARYRWTTEGLPWRLDVTSDCLDYIVYAPAGKPYFCFEPTSHKPSPGQTGDLDGLVMVEPGGVLRREARFTVNGGDARSS